MSASGLPFAAAAIFYSYGIGAHFVIIAWIASEVGGFAAVGQTLVVGNLFTLLLGPMLGIEIDKQDRRSCFIVGAVISAFAMGTLACLRVTDSILVLMAATLAFHFGMALQGPSLEAIQQQITPAEDRAQAAIVRNILRQIGLVSGAGLSGILISSQDFGVAFSVTISCCGLAAISAFAGLPKCRPPARSRAPYFRTLREGIGALSQPLIASIGAVIVLSFTAGQVVNASLAVYVRERGYDAHLYGMTDALWSVGAFVCALLLGRAGTWKKQMPDGSVGLLGLGVGLIGLSLTTGDGPIMLTGALLGVFFSYGKVLSDSRLLVECDTGTIGRVRSNLNAFQGLIGLIIYLSPTYIPGLGPDMMMRTAGAVIIAGFAAILVIKLRAPMAFSRSAEHD